MSEQPKQIAVHPPTTRYAVRWLPKGCDAFQEWNECETRTEAEQLQASFRKIFADIPVVIVKIATHEEAIP